MDRLRILSRRDFLTYLSASAVSAAAVGIGGIALDSTPEPSSIPKPDSTPTTPPADATKPPTRTLMPNPTPNAYGAICMTTDRAKPETSKACATADGHMSWGPDAVDAQGILMREYMKIATPLPEFAVVYPDPNTMIGSEGKTDVHGNPIFFKPEGK